MGGADGTVTSSCPGLSSIAEQKAGWQPLWDCEDDPHWLLVRIIAKEDVMMRAIIFYQQARI